MRILADGNDERTDALQSVRHMPGGSSTYVDLGGRLPRMVPARLLFASEANYKSFRALTNTTQTLIDAADSDGPFAAVLMAPVTREDRHPGGTVLARAEFLIT